MCLSTTFARPLYQSVILSLTWWLAGNAISLQHIPGSRTEAASPEYFVDVPSGAPGPQNQTLDSIDRASTAAAASYAESEVDTSGIGSSDLRSVPKFAYNALIQVYRHPDQIKPEANPVLNLIATGTLIRRNQVLTAGSTCYDVNRSEAISKHLIHVLVGASTLTGDSMTSFAPAISATSRPVPWRGVEKVIVHPYYTGPSTFPSIFDMCILVLSSENVGQQRVRPAELGDEDVEMVLGDPVFTFGWGMMDATRYPSTLQGLSTGIAQCSYFLPYAYSMKMAIWCTNGNQGDEYFGGACWGDVGAPLIQWFQDDDGRFHDRVVGIFIRNNAAAPCGNKGADVLEVFLNICAPESRTWIDTAEEPMSPLREYVKYYLQEVPNDLATDNQAIASHLETNLNNMVRRRHGHRMIEGVVIEEVPHFTSDVVFTVAIWDDGQAYPDYIVSLEGIHSTFPRGTHPNFATYSDFCYKDPGPLRYCLTSGGAYMDRLQVAGTQKYVVVIFRHLDHDMTQEALDDFKSRLHDINQDIPRDGQHVVLPLHLAEIGGMIDRAASFMHRAVAAEGGILEGYARAIYVIPVAPRASFGFANRYGQIFKKLFNFKYELNDGLGSMDIMVIILPSVKHAMQDFPSHVNNLPTYWMGNG